MQVAEVVLSLLANANGVCFLFAVLISFVFYHQYKKYEREAKENEVVERFLS